MNLEVKQLININNDILNIISTWMYNWWGKSERYSFEKVECFMKHGMQEHKLPQTHGLFLDNKIIGMFQFTYEDLSVRPDIYPWLANVYIDEKYRKQGYGRKLLENVKKIAREKIDFKEIFSYTEHIGLYEKFGWTYLCDVDTYKEENRMERLYKLNLE